MLSAAVVIGALRVNVITTYNANIYLFFAYCSRKLVEKYTKIYKEIYNGICTNVGLKFNVITTYNANSYLFCAFVPQLVKKYTNLEMYL